MAALGGCLVHDLPDAVVHDEHRFSCAHELRREYRAVEDQVRRPGHQHLVFELAGSPSVPFAITAGARPAATAASLPAAGTRRRPGR